MDRPLPRPSDLPQSDRLGRTAALAEALDTLLDPSVRDLAWLLFAPRLLSESAFGSLLVPPPDDIVELLRVLRELDADPAPLRASLAPLTTRRVGHYAERLVHYALSHLSSFTLIAANLPLRVGKQTVGEFDFLLEDPAGVRLHWELAVKCYLRVEVPELDNALASFVGPALGDRLDIKVQRLLAHQLPLSGRADIASLIPNGPWQAQMWVSGWLFDRFDRWWAQAPIAIDPRLSPEVLTGFWVSADKWAEAAALMGATGWTQLPRLRWMAPLAQPDHSFCDVAEMTARITDAFAVQTSLAEVAISTPSPVIGDLGILPSQAEATLETPRVRSRDDPFAIAGWKQGADGRWVECARGFIVADDWEPRARAFAAG
jgi:hypothetical protein